MLYISIICLILLVGIIYLKADNNKLKIHFFTALIFKLICGAGIGYLYFSYYRMGDTIQYDQAVHLVLNNISPSFFNWVSFLIYSDLSFIQETLPHVLVESRSLFFVKILSLLYLISDRSYWISSLYLSLFSFWGAWILVGTVVKYWPDSKYAGLISFLYFPTIVFWSSGVLKESIAFACISLIAALFIQWYNGRSFRFLYFIYIIFLFWMLWSIKYHYAAIMFLSISSGFIFATTYNKFVFTNRYLIFFGIFFMMALITSIIHPNFHFSNIMDVINSNHIKIIEISKEKNLIKFLPFGTGIYHFLINIPVSFFGGLFMPFPWQGNSILPKLSGIFNLIILLLTTYKLVHLKITPNRINIWMLMAVTYVFILAIVMAYTTPNFGTLERYKISYMPFFLFWILYEKSIIKRLDGLFGN